MNSEHTQKQQCSPARKRSRKRCRHGLVPLLEHLPAPIPSQGIVPKRNLQPQSQLAEKPRPNYQDHPESTDEQWCQRIKRKSRSLMLETGGFASHNPFSILATKTKWVQYDASQRRQRSIKVSANKHPRHKKKSTTFCRSQPARSPKVREHSIIPPPWAVWKKDHPASEPVPSPGPTGTGEPPSVRGHQSEALDADDGMPLLQSSLSSCSSPPGRLEGRFWSSSSAPSSTTSDASPCLAPSGYWARGGVTTVQEDLNWLEDDTSVTVTISPDEADELIPAPEPTQAPEYHVSALIHNQQNLQVSVRYLPRRPRPMPPEEIAPENWQQYPPGWSLDLSYL